MDAFIMYKATAIEGQGIGPEVTKHGVDLILRVAERFDFPISINHIQVDDQTYFSIDESKVNDLIGSIKDDDFIIFGAIGAPNKSQDMHGGGLIIDIRQKLNLFINMRPSRLINNALCPLKEKTDFDLLIIRENTEGEYVNIGGRYQKGTKQEIAIQESIYTAKNTAETIKYAFEMALRRRKHLTLVDKSNVLTYGHGLWKELFYHFSAEFNEVTVDHFYIDAMVAKVIGDPGFFDVIVCPNMFGDILSDLTAELQGGIGTAGSINLGLTKPFLIEPVHGSAPDIAGKGIANPIGMLHSICLMFVHLDRGDVAARIFGIIDELVSEGKTTPDLNGKMTSEQFMNYVYSRLLFGETK